MGDKQSGIVHGHVPGTDNAWHSVTLVQPQTPPLRYWGRYRKRWRKTYLLFAVSGVVLSTAVLAGCGGVRSSEPAAKYSPAPAARDRFQAQVEEQLGPSWMSRIYDHDSFRKGAQDIGDTACRNALSGHSRDDFQKGFRESTRSAGSYAGYPDSVLDAQSLMFWSLAIRNLCPSVGGAQ